MTENYSQQKGFGLILVIIAVLIIAVIAFGFISRRKGQIEQNQEIKNKAVEDLKAINEKLEKNNQEIKNDLEEKK